jgi:hypothetical protein
VRRADRSRQRPRAEEPEPRRRPPDGEPQPPRRARGDGSKLGRDLLVAVVAFALGVGVAELFGAANLGVAFGVGQVVFGVVVVVLLIRG